MFYLPAFRPRSFPPLYIHSFIFIYSHTLLPPPKRKPRKQNQNQQTKTVEKNKPTKPMDPVLCWSATPGYVAYLELLLIYPSMLYCRKLIFPFLSGTHYKNQGRRLCLLSIFSIGILSGLNLRWSCGCS